MKKLVQCVSLLNSYLAVYCTDLEAWKELCMLNIESGEVRLSNTFFFCSIRKSKLVAKCMRLQIAKAKYCVEEMLLLAPQDGNIVLLNAELHYSLAMTLSGHKVTETTKEREERTSRVYSCVFCRCVCVCRHVEDGRIRIGKTVLRDGIGTAAAAELARAVRAASLLREAERRRRQHNDIDNDIDVVESFGGVVFDQRFNRCFNAVRSIVAFSYL